MKPSPRDMNLLLRISQHEGDWVKADAWYADAADNAQADLMAVADALAADDPTVLRNLPAEYLEAIQNLGLLAIHELAQRWLRNREQQDPE